jgi:hypothetical protein
MREDFKLIAPEMENKKDNRAGGAAKKREDKVHLKVRFPEWIHGCISMYLLALPFLRTRNTFLSLLVIF